MIFNLSKKKFKDFARFDKEYASNFVHSITLFWEPPPKKTRLETKNVPPIPPHFLQRWWCKWWLYNVLCEETKCCRNPEKWSAEYYMVKNVWDNLIIYTTPYISYTKYISPWKKSSKRHEQMTSPLMPNTCTERGHEAQYKKWRAGWCALMKIIYFSLGRFLTSWYSLLESFKK